MEIERKLASIRKISAIDKIPDADNIVVASVDGWKVVVKKGEFKVGDLAVYFEIDSWIPVDIAPFLCKGKEPREYDGVKGERLKTIRLKGQVSQGLLLPIADVEPHFPEELVAMQLGNYVEGEDLTNLLNIKKWEKPIPTQLAGLVKGNFPSFIYKTDQERVQNLSGVILKLINDNSFEVTEKLDGSSMTVYSRNGEFGVCSRNLDLKRDENNAFWKAAIADDLEKKLDDYSLFGGNIAIQGELIGEGIQNNPYKMKGQKFYVFDIFDTDNLTYMSPEKRRNVCAYLGLDHVPVITPVWGNQKMMLSAYETVVFLLNSAEKKSAINPVVDAEGIVFKSNEHPGVSFKAISNKYLLKHDA